MLLLANVWRIRVALHPNFDVENASGPEHDAMLLGLSQHLASSSKRMREVKVEGLPQTGAYSRPFELTLYIEFWVDHFIRQGPVLGRRFAKKGVVAQRNGFRPCRLYLYGGFQCSMFQGGFFQWDEFSLSI